MQQRSVLQVAFFASLAILGFAANAVINPLALLDHTLDATSYAALRLVAAAVMLWLFMHIFQRPREQQTSSKVAMSHGSWSAAFILFIYAVTFSYGYLAVDTATGTLILAGVVQFTMIGAALLRGSD